MVAGPHIFQFETFFNRYEALTLGFRLRAVGTQVVVEFGSHARTRGPNAASDRGLGHVGIRFNEPGRSAGDFGQIPNPNACMASLGPLRQVFSLPELLSARTARSVATSALSRTAVCTCELALRKPAMSTA